MFKIFKNVWPLIFSALSLVGIGHLIPQMYWDFQFSRHAVSVPAWYTDLNQDSDTFHYAYKVEDTTFGGEAPWSDADSDIYYHQPGDACSGVEYLAARPWRSAYRRNFKQELHWDRVWIGWELVVFFMGILLSWPGIRELRRPAL